jgi:hypothetical protein
MTGSVRIDVAPPEWLIVPENAAEHPTWAADALTLFELVADVDGAAEGDMRVFDDGRVLDPADAVGRLLAFEGAMRADVAGGGTDGMLVAGLTVPFRWPQPVVVTVREQGDGDLVDVLGAHDGQPAQEPSIDALPEHLGDGVVVTRFDLDDEGAVWASVAAARRQDGVDTVALWRTTDLELIPAFAGDVVELVGAVRVTTDA